jgi:hypothetical protein
MIGVPLRQWLWRQLSLIKIDCSMRPPLGRVSLLLSTTAAFDTVTACERQTNLFLPNTVFRECAGDIVSSNTTDIFSCDVKCLATKYPVNITYSRYPVSALQWCGLLLLLLRHPPHRSSIVHLPPIHLSLYVSIINLFSTPETQRRCYISEA